MQDHSTSDFSKFRNDMVAHVIHARGVRSERVLNAMRDVPRELFLPPQLRECPP